MLGRKTALVAVAVGLGLSVLTFFAMRSVAFSDAQKVFDERAQRVADAIEAKVALPVQGLEAILAYRRSQDTDDNDAARPPVLEPARRAAFARFARALLERHPSLAALELAHVVAATDRADFERYLSQSLSQPGRPEPSAIAIREPDLNGAKTAPLVASPMRERHYPLIAIEPWSEGVIGLDVAFEPERRRAIETAIERAERYCSPRFTMVEDPEGTHSVAVYEPEYRGGFVPEDKAARRERIVGLAIAIFRIDPLVRHALDGLDMAGLAIAIHDRSPDLDSTDPRSELFAANPSSLSDTPRAPDASEATIEKTFEFAGRRWAVEVRAALRPAMGGAWVALALGAGVSVFIALALGALAEARRFRREMKDVKQLGQYEVIRLIAAGGMGRVYEARHLLLKRRTALKVVSREVATEEMLRRFEREVHATSLLSHPNTVVVFDYGRSHDGHFYYAMEYIDGPSFDALVRFDGPLPAERVKALSLQVCGALAEAHAQGFVHRDVKPQNLMVTRRGGRHDYVKVLDFGLIKDMHARSGTRLTESGSVTGTPGYLPPEVFDSPSRVGPAVDVYAVGCVIHLLYTGREVFESPLSSEVIAKHIAEIPRPPSERFGLDPVFDTIIMRCLAKDPAERFATCAELLRALELLRLDPFPDVMAQASWQRWEAVRDTRAPTGLDDHGAALQRLGIALKPTPSQERIHDARAYQRTETGIRPPAP